MQDKATNRARRLATAKQLPGRNTLFEYACSPESNLNQVAKEIGFNSIWRHRLVGSTACGAVAWTGVRAQRSRHLDVPSLRLPLSVAVTKCSQGWLRVNETPQG